LAYYTLVKEYEPKQSTGKNVFFKLILAIFIITNYIFLLNVVHADHEAGDPDGAGSGMGDMGNMMGGMGDMGNMMGGMGDMGNMGGMGDMGNMMGGMGDMMGGMMGGDMSMPMALDVVSVDGSRHYEGTYYMTNMWNGFPVWNNPDGCRGAGGTGCYIFNYNTSEWHLQGYQPGAVDKVGLVHRSTLSMWPWEGGFPDHKVTISNNVDMNSMMGNMMGGMGNMMDGGGGMSMPNSSNSTSMMLPAMDTGYMCNGEPRVIFPDSNLFSAIINDIESYQIGVSFSAGGRGCEPNSITLYSLQEIRKMDISNSQITNLWGIEYFSNLEKLKADNNYIVDIEPLQELFNLRELIINNNYLILQDQDPRYPPEENPITNLQRIGVRVEATYISLNDLLTKRGVDQNTGKLSRDQIIDILYEDLDPAQIRSLNQTQPSSVNQNQQNTVDSCGQVSRFVQFQDESLARGIQNTMKSEGLRFCSGGGELEIDSKSLQNVTSLVLNGQGINSLEGIQGLVNLVDLELDNNRITNLDALGSLKSLRNLLLGNNQICQNNFNPWDSLRGLGIEELSVVNACISGLDFTDDLRNLRSIYLDDNPISESQLYKIQDLQNRGVQVFYNGNISENQQGYQNNSNNLSTSSVNESSSFYYEEEGSSRGFLFKVDEVPEWAKTLGLTDINTLLDPTVIAMFGIFITLLGTVSQMARGR